MFIKEIVGELTDSFEDPRGASVDSYLAAFKSDERAVAVSQPELKLRSADLDAKKQRLV